MRPRVLKIRLTLMGFGGILAGAILGTSIGQLVFQ